MTAQAEILEVLAWIWDTITEPVLTALGYTTTPSSEESWPRCGGAPSVSWPTCPCTPRDTTAT
jgi:hypothetical protein